MLKRKIDETLELWFKNRKAAFLIMILIIVPLLFFGCKKIVYENEYNAIVLSKESYNFNKTFLDNNKTFGAWSEKEKDYIKDESYSRELIIVIQSDEELREAFDDFIDVDFKNEMVILYGFTTATNIHKNRLLVTEVSVDDGKLIIKYGEIDSGDYTPDASNPQTKWHVFKMNKVDISEVEIKYIGYLNNKRKGKKK